MTPDPNHRLRKKRLPLLLCALGIALAILITGLTILRSTSLNNTLSSPLSQYGTAPGSTPQAQPAEPVSPLIFGTNMSLFASATTDQMLASSPTLAMMQRMHVRIVRMPIRPGVPENVEIQAAQSIKRIGAVPLIILNGLLVRDPLSVDTRIVRDMNAIFGNSIVYYEFGNEEDLNGISMEKYADGWNRIIPSLKRLALNGHFIGPVSYKYNRGTLAIFLRRVQPRPDEISWHEYVCSYKSQPDSCIAGIEAWTDHITDARRVMQQTIGSVLPIMITEWNYAPDLNVLPNGQVTNDDGKHDNATFMTAWTTKALQTLAANRVFASMQYAVTNTPIPMIGLNDSLTPQGAAFQSMYQQIILNKQAPPQPTATTQ